MRRDLELDVVVGMYLPSGEVCHGRRVDEHIVLAVIRTPDGTQEAELAAEPRAVAP